MEFFHFFMDDPFYLHSLDLFVIAQLESHTRDGRLGFFKLVSAVLEFPHNFVPHGEVRVEGFGSQDGAGLAHVAGGGQRLL